MNSKCFSTMEIDAIGEILNISLGASATAVSTMLNARVDITTPIVSVVTKEEFEMKKVEPAVGVEITYVCGLEGENIMLLKRHDVKVIVEMLMGMSVSDEEFELNEMNISAVCEVMNQMMGASSTALSEFLGEVVNISTPISFEVKNEEEFIDKYFKDNKPKVMVGFTLKIADKLESEFFNVMPMELAKSLVKGFLPESEIVGTDAEEAVQPAPAEPASSGSSGTLSQEEIEKLLAGGVAEEAQPVSSAPAMGQPASGGSSGTLSQEEIEKLLAGGVEEEAQPASSAPAMGQPAPTGMPAMEQPAQGMPAMGQPMQGMPAMGQPVQNMAAMAQPSMDMSMMQLQIMQQMQQQMQQMQEMMMQAGEKKNAAPEPKMINVQAASNPSLTADSNISLAGVAEENMEMIMGVPLEVSVEIGRTKKLVKDVLDFTKGSLIVLDKLAGEQVDLYVNGQCIAKGDVVVVEDNFGIRVTEIMKAHVNILE